MQVIIQWLFADFDRWTWRLELCVTNIKHTWLTFSQKARCASHKHRLFTVKLLNGRSGCNWKEKKRRWNILNYELCSFFGSQLVKSHFQCHFSCEFNFIESSLKRWWWHTHTWRRSRQLSLKSKRINFHARSSFNFARRLWSSHFVNGIVFKNFRANITG